jgi:hypothetical protein
MARRLLFQDVIPRSGEFVVLGFRKRNASSSVLSATVEKDHLLWSLGSLCQLFRVPFDARLILQRFPPPYTLATLCEAAQLLGFSVREEKMPAGKKFPAHGLPAPGFAARRQQRSGVDSQDRRRACPIV